MKKLGEAIGKFVVKHRILIVIASILLCIPSLFGYINTDINYDILVYLPEDIDTMKGQDILLRILIWDLLRCVLSKICHQKIS